MEPQQSPRTNTLAIVALVLAFLAPLVGAILGHVSLSQIKKNQEAGRGLGLAAVIVGWVFTALGIVALVVWLVFVVFLGTWQTAIVDEMESNGGDSSVIDEGMMGDQPAVEGDGTYGSDPSLDALWDACESGDGQACDDLWWMSQSGTEYEEFGGTCGGRSEFGANCLELLGAGSVPPEGGTYGSDPRLDSLWDSCAAGDFAACDTLWSESPLDSEYEEFADTCGGRNEPSGSCVSIYEEG